MFIRLPPSFLRAEERRFLREWLLLGAAGVTFIVLLVACHLTRPADRILYDWWFRHRSVPASTDIVIVAIDDRSINKLGRWPWSRQVHADALLRIAAGSPRAVLYDVLFTEPGAQDAALADAMSHVPVYLPLVIESGPANPEAGNALLPVEPLRAAAAGIGHINLETEQDGIIRNVSLFEGNRRQLWPQFVIPAYRGARGRNAPLLGPPASRVSDSQPIVDPVFRSEKMLIPFSGDGICYAQVAFVDVLDGKVNPAMFRDKFVLVGATADGLLEHLTTPVSGQNGSMSGIEIHANILDALLSGRYIATADVWAVVLYSASPLALLLLALLYLTPRQTIVLLPTLIGAAVFGSGMLLLKASVWISPVPAALALLVVYPTWSWRRLEVAMSFISAELEQLANEPQLVRDQRITTFAFVGHSLEHNIALMRQAARQVRDLKRFVWDSLNSLPDPVLVSDSAGYIRLANDPARAWLTPPVGKALEGCTLQEILSTLSFVRLIDGAPSAARGRPWPALLSPTHAGNLDALERGVEVADASGHHFVLRYARCTSSAGELIGWIASLNDVTALHAAQSQRDEMLHLLSHDMRSPQSSIIALIDIERPKAVVTGQRLTYDRIERYARRTLALADSFVQLAAAETCDYALEVANFSDLLNSAVDEVWPLANAKHITLAYDTPDGEFPVRTDRSMIARALVNLLNNAVKYSPPHTRIDCALSLTGETPARLRCVIRDQGYGISHEQRLRLFKRFQRFRVPGQPDSEGVGLGLAFVRTVITRHGGTIDCDSAPGHGTTMTLHLPVVALAAATRIDEAV
ncbi:CHASE2 domain-containing protein [Burkholderia pyrrocinia]|uniref:CHASE2 domain-containing protein n=1 Tax=Burkholderia pyrrocinia TaxID=60550 RepID=UPI0015894BB0|nr:CHASE2 domain-containing protein [Burkholderia pyrrocinia]